MRKKIGIVTIDDSSNYGNRLQNFAMQEMLNSLGHEVSTIHICLFKDLASLWVENKKYCIKQYLYSFRLLRFVVCKIKRKQYIKNPNIVKDNKINDKRIIEFEKFNKLFIEYDENIIQKEPIENKLYCQYDYLVTGSDQVWNPIYSWPKSAMYLRFVPKQKRIAISASFGISYIPKEYKRILKKYLNGMKYISVREESGQKIVKALTGHDCDSIMDPTLMVAPDVWDKVQESAEVKLPQKYMLTYFLGDVSEKKKICIEKIANENNCKLIWMNSKEHKEIYNWGPEKFIKAIRGCECFFTDSFHGCVFSILFHRQFQVFRREDNQPNMFDRIRTLLRAVNLESQIANDEKLNLEWIAETRFEKADFILEEERARVRQILRKVLS